MHLVDLLSMSFMAVGAIAGLAIGLLLAFALHWLFPTHNLSIPVALIVAFSSFIGAFIGSRFDLKP